MAYIPKPQIRRTRNQFLKNDLSFNVLKGFNGDISIFKRQPDGKILIGGDFTRYNGIPRYYIIRLNSDYSLDTNFLAGDSLSGFNASIGRIDLQSDGKIIVSGSFTKFKDTNLLGVARLNSNGTLDTSFTSPPNSSYVVDNTVANQDKLYSAYGTIRRYNSDGALDTSFTSYNATGEVVSNVSIQTDGKILVSSYSQFFDPEIGFIVTPYLVRLNTNGSVDSTFDPSSVLNVGGIVNGTKQLSDGKIIVWGRFSSGIPVLRLNSNGTVDASFNPNFFTYEDFGIYQVEVISTGYLCVGQFSGGEYGIKCNISGTKDTSYPNFRTISYGVLVLPSEDVLISYYAGKFLELRNSSGVVQNNWTEGPDSFVNLIERMPDNGYLIAGSFKKINNTTANGFARLDSNGFLNTSFNVGTGFNTTPARLTINSNNTIFVFGAFTGYNGSPANRIICLDFNGNLASGISFEQGFNGNVVDAKYMYNGNIIVCGNFTTYRTVSCTKAVILNPDGSLNSNTVSIGTAQFTAAGVQSDNKIVLGGTFTNRIMRINSDGTSDPLFTTVANGNINKIIVLPDDKIFIIGSFTTVNGISKLYLCKLNSDGTIDNSFAIPTGTVSSITNAYLDSDGGLILLCSTPYLNRSILKLRPNGTPDTSFFINSYVSGISNITISSTDLTLAGSFDNQSIPQLNGVYLTRLLRSTY